MVKVKNTGTPVYIGATHCEGKGAITSVSKIDLENYLKTPSGAFRFKNTLTVYDEDFIKQQKKDAMAIKAAAEATVRAKIEKQLTSEITERLERSNKKNIKSLNDRISDLVEKVRILEEENAHLKKGSGGDDPPKDEDDPEPPVDTPGKLVLKTDAGDSFEFDPEKNHIEHRGGGNWYVMDKEEKVFGPVTPEQKSEIVAILEG